MKENWREIADLCEVGVEEVYDEEKYFQKSDKLEGEER